MTYIAARVLGQLIEEFTSLPEVRPSESAALESFKSLGENQQLMAIQELVGVEPTGDLAIPALKDTIQKLQEYGVDASIRPLMTPGSASIENPLGATSSRARIMSELMKHPELKEKAKSVILKYTAQ